MLTDEIVIDAEFAALIPPLTAEERSQLEANLVSAGGARDALVAWRDGGRLVLLDGHNRHEICTRLGLPFEVREIEVGGREEATEWLIRNQFGRRNLSAYDRTILALRLEEAIAAKAKANVQRGGGSGSSGRHKCDNPIDTKREIASLAGVSHQTVAKVKRIAEAERAGHVDASTVAKLRAGNVSIHRVDSSIREAAANRKAEEARKEAVETVRLHEAVRVGDFRDVLGDIPAGSVDLIFTDPPYDRDSVAMYADMAEMAARILRPGGSLVTYLGKHVMPEVCDLMGRHLKFLWPLCCLHAGTGSLMTTKGIRVKWKPMLWFVNGTNRYDTASIVEDLVESAKEKTDHPWQQAVVEADYYIRKLSPEGGLVVDPFCGGGTTAIAAIRAGREIVTCDIDEKWAKVASRRIEEATR